MRRVGNALIAASALALLVATPAAADQPAYPPSTPEASVQPNRVSSGSGGSEAAGDELASTGSDTAAAALLGGALLVAGGGALVASRRRAGSH